MSKCCGTCKYWNQVDFTDYGVCEFVPTGFPASMQKENMHSFEGSICTCWEKERKNNG